MLLAFPRLAIARVGAAHARRGCGAAVSVQAPHALWVSQRYLCIYPTLLQSARGIGPASIQSGNFRGADGKLGEGGDETEYEANAGSTILGGANETTDTMLQQTSDGEVAQPRVLRQPLSLVEEVPLPQRVLTDLELIMTAWCEEHARQYAMILIVVRAGIFLLLFIIAYVFYRVQLSSERVMRGVDNVPADLRIGSLVYFDISENGNDIGRVVIGLLNENCPLYCEYFHRRCTASGGEGESFRGMQLSAIVPRHVLIFGDGKGMTHDVPGFDPHYLPTEFIGQGSWRGALSSIAYSECKESPNFAIHVSAGDYSPQIFAIIVGGYNVIERINAAGSSFGNSPKKTYTIEACGELCTLAKSHITPMPWKLYNSISRGYDEVKFGERIPSKALHESHARSDAIEQTAMQFADGGAGGGGGGGEKSTTRNKSWWRTLLNVQ